MHDVGPLSLPNQHVFRFHVPMHKVLFVTNFKSLQYLDCNKQHRLEVELTLAGLEKVLEGWPKEVHHHHMEILVWNGVVRADVIQVGYESFTTE